MEQLDALNTRRHQGFQVRCDRGLVDVAANEMKKRLRPMLAGRRGKALTQFISMNAVAGNDTKQRKGDCPEAERGS
jgi:hypothetical protein